MDNILIILDGSNIAHHKQDLDKKARYKNLELLTNYLKLLKKRFPIKWELIVDASLRHNIDKKHKLESLIDKGRIIQCPSKSEADNFIIEFHKRHPENAIIITNDNFDDHDIFNLRLFKFTIIFEEIVIFPNLEEFLENKFNILKKVKINV